MYLLERQEQLAILNRSLQEARAGCGKLVLLAGEAGLGKSSLVERFVSDHRRDTRALWGACDALSTPRALGPVHEIAAQTSSGRSAHDEDSRDWLFRTLLEEFTRLADGCVVVLEDLHWADAATLDFLRFIGRRIQRTSALFIATYRDDELPANLGVRLALGELVGDHVVRVRLAPLSLAAVEVLSKESGRDAGLLHRTTGGNPFFVREVLASPGEVVPETVRDAVLARLMRCSPATRELVQLVSTSPGVTEGWLIESVLGQRQGELDEAGARGLLEVHSDSVGFRHELTRLAVIGTLPPERARALHGQVLRALATRAADPARLVHHAVLAQDTAAIIEYAPHAARQAGRLGAHREAATHLAAALQHGTRLSAPQRAQLLDQHAEESSLANQTRAAIASWTAAAAAWDELGDTRAQSRALGLLTQEYRTVGDRARADDCVARAISLLEAQPPGVALAGAYCARALLALHRGWNFEALEFGRRALALAREAGDRATESHALCHIGGALLGLDDRSGYEPLERSLAIALELRLEDQAARAYRTLEFYASLTRDVARATRAFQEGVDYCEERGIFSHSAYIRSYHTICELWRGEWADAARMAEELLRTAEVTGPTQRVTVMTTLAVVRIRRGDPGAEPLLDEALALALPTAEVNRIARVAAARAEHAWYQGRLADVLTESSIGLAQVLEHPSPWLNGELLYWQSRVRPTAISGEVAGPYRLMLTGDWRAAAEAWARIGAPYEQALALAEGTEESLRQALAIVERLGAGPLAAIVRRRMRDLGVRSIPRGPNETTRANPSGLTRKELEVLRLLAAGCSNAQLARRLHRSPKTIDHHVSSLLEKLGVHSRAEAVAAAFARGILAAETSPAAGTNTATPARPA